MAPQNPPENTAIRPIPITHLSLLFTICVVLTWIYQAGAIFGIGALFLGSQALPYLAIYFACVAGPSSLFLLLGMCAAHTPGGTRLVGLFRHFLFGWFGLAWCAGTLYIATSLELTVFLSVLYALPVSFFFVWIAYASDGMYVWAATNAARGINRELRGSVELIGEWAKRIKGKQREEPQAAQTQEAENAADSTPVGSEDASEVTPLLEDELV